jgi:flagellar protein FlaG
MVEITNIIQADIQPRKQAEPPSTKAQVRSSAETIRSNSLYSNAASVELSPGSVRVQPPDVQAHASAPEIPIASVGRIVGEINDNLTLINADLAIEVDRELKQVIFKVVDLETGETIKQIPSKEMVELARKLKFMVENYSNNSASGKNISIGASSFA